MQTATAVAVRFPATSDSLLTILETISEGKRVMKVRKNESIFHQGDRPDAIFFVQTGRVKISALSPSGKEAVFAMLGAQGFLGQESLIGQAVRTGTATALEPSTVIRVEKRAMLRALHALPELSGQFMTLLLTRNIDLEQDLCDQLLNFSEKRLARALLKLVDMGNDEGVPDARISILTHETLAEMVGTTRARICRFLNKFEKMGLVEYTRHSPLRNKGALIVRTERLFNLVLRK